MELLYAYIDKYRDFEKCEIPFSNKFILKFSKSQNTLTIVKNPNYIKMYPYNIVGITGIVGKNASGKTSLLDLIGNKIASRFNNNEMVMREEDPHENFDLLSLTENDDEEIKYVSSYFFVYYLGKDEDDKDIFIFESNNPSEYIGILKNSNDITKEEIEHPPKISYYESKCWIPYIFTISNNDLLLKRNIQDYGKIQNTYNTNFESSIKTKIYDFDDELVKRLVENVKVNRNMSIEIRFYSGIVVVEFLN